MHRFNFSLILLLFVSQVAFCQNPVSFVFNKRDDINSGNVDAGIKPYYWNNGILYLGYCYNSSQTKEGLTLTFYDTLGNMQWKKAKILDEYQIFQGNDIIALNNTSFYIGGVVYKNEDTQYDRFLAKYDKDGNNIFTKIYPDSTLSWVMDLEYYYGDTLLVLSAITPSQEDEYTKIVIDKVDTVGNICTTYEGPYTLEIPYQILKGNNRFYVGGTRKTAVGSNYHVKVFIQSFDNNLNFLYDNNPGETLNERFGHMIFHNNLIYLTHLTTVYQPPNTSGFYQCCASILDQNTYPVRHQRFGPIDFYGDLKPNVALNENMIIFPVYEKLYFLDTAVNVICSTPELNSDSLNLNLSEIIVLPNKKIAGTGVYYSTSQTDSQDHWNFMTENIEEYINSNCLESIPFEYKNEKITSQYSVYPTIFNTSVFIKCINDHQNFKIEIYDELGIKKYEAEDIGETEINTSNLINGLYFLRIIDKTKINSFKLIKQ